MKRRDVLRIVSAALPSVLGCGGGNAQPRSPTSRGDSEATRQLGTPALLGESDHPLYLAKAPLFALPLVAGGGGSGTLGLEAALQSVTLVDFWATWCKPCRGSFPHYEALKKRFPGRVNVVGVCEDDAPDQIDDFRRETSVTFPLVWDHEQHVAALYQPRAMPTCFFLDAERVVRGAHEGFRPGDETEVLQAVEHLLSGAQHP